MLIFRQHRASRANIRLERMRLNCYCQCMDECPRLEGRVTCCEEEPSGQQTVLDTTGEGALSHHQYRTRRARNLIQTVPRMPDLPLAVAGVWSQRVPRSAVQLHREQHSSHECSVGAPLVHVSFACNLIQSANCSFDFCPFVVLPGSYFSFLFTFLIISFFLYITPLF
jgi:hypothetical protein